ncbi:hypothetical protein D3C72_1800390 [compost metagenome]
MAESAKAGDDYARIALVNSVSFLIVLFTCGLQAIEHKDQQRCDAHGQRYRQGQAFTPRVDQDAGNRCCAKHDEGKLTALTEKNRLPTTLFSRDTQEATKEFDHQQLDQDKTQG